MSFRPWSRSFRSTDLRSHWNRAASRVECLYGAPSTDVYERDEKLLFEQAFGDLRGKKLLKLDLWNEGRNTRILLWAAEQGARVFGIDISDDVCRHAAGSFAGCGVEAGLVLGDIRHLPYADNSMDCIYSMGTIEHLPDPQTPVDEVARVLKPGGRAVIGVPNKLDPFARPFVVAFLQALGKYPYAPERSYTFRQLCRMAERAGLKVAGRGGVLFMPGSLRMLDLFIHLRMPALRPIAAAAVKPFARVTDVLPSLNRHGYLVAVIAEKPSY